MVAIIDYDAGNVRSVEKAFRYLGEETLLTRDQTEIRRASRVVLPGVGAFGEAVKRLDTYGLTEVIREVCADDTPFLGICLGLQLLFSSSEESPGARGLGILPGSVKRFDDTDQTIKIPHIGWNDLQFTGESRLFRGIPDGSYVYFVHSYYLTAEDASVVKARTTYGVTFDAAVESGNVFACQFHPEKSAETGLQILTNFLKV